MKITVLVENTSKRDDLKTVHGLGVYIETPKHKMLFDLGPDDTVFDNAMTLGIDLGEIDTVIISHGHYDHGGALASFLEINKTARIYARRQAFEPHYADVGDDKLFVGLDAVLAEDKRVTLTDDTMRIDDELFVFSDVDGILDTQSRRALLKKTSDGYEQDDFDHEQSLIVTAEGKAVLFSGCSHSGADVILTAALRRQPDIKTVFGGFHMYNPNTGATEPEALITALAGRLSAHDAVFYTCHCTGEKAFGLMRETMGEKLRYIQTGAVVEL